jgi:hypothetical protein
MSGDVTGVFPDIQECDSPSAVELPVRDVDDEGRPGVTVLRELF